jgi:hypothetical protein
MRESLELMKREAAKGSYGKRGDDDEEIKRVPVTPKYMRSPN